MAVISCVPLRAGSNLDGRIDWLNRTRGSSMAYLGYGAGLGW